MESSPTLATTGDPESPTNVTIITTATETATFLANALLSVSSTVDNLPVENTPGQDRIPTNAVAHVHVTDITVELPIKTQPPSTTEEEPSTSATCIPPTPSTSTSTTSSSTKHARCLKCRHCTFRTEHSALLLAHLRWHTKQRQKECETNNSHGEGDSIDGDPPIVTSKPRPTVRLRSWYKCTECTFSTSVSRRLRWHMNTHKPKRTYKCEECAGEFDRVEDLRRHKREEHGVKDPKLGTVQRTCPICPFSSFSSSKLNVHIMSHSKDNRYKCEKCDFATKWKQTLAHHMDTKHTPPIVVERVTKRETKTETKHKCLECSYTSKWTQTLRRHMNTVHSTVKKKLTCDKCTYRTKLSDKMNEHKLSHEKSTRCKCSFAGCSFATRFRRTLALHEEEEHPKEESGTFKCEKCIYTTTMRSFLLKHEQSHKENGVPIVTALDPTKTKFRNLPRTVITSLTDIGVDEERRYQCADCKFVTDHEITLAWHVNNVHIERAQDTTIDTMHQCPQCAFRSPRGLVLAGHVERVHGGVKSKSRRTRIKAVPSPVLTKLPFSIVDPKLESIVDGINVKSEPIEDSELSMAAAASRTRSPRER